MTKRYSITLVLLFMLEYGYAQQFRYGIELGGNYNKMTDNKNVLAATAIPKATFGGRVGIVGDYSLTEHLYIQPAVFFVMKSNKETAVTSATINIPISSFNVGAGAALSMKQESRFYYAEVPVSILYKWGETGSGRFFIGLTPYAAYGIGGSQTVKEDLTASAAFILNYDTSIRNTSSKTFADDSFGYQKLDYGFKVCEGYEFANGLFFRVDVGLGLANISNYPGAKSHTMGAGLSIGYLMGNKRRK